MNEKMREEFVVWQCLADQGPQRDPIWMMHDKETNKFAFDKIQSDWVVWQASREALVIQLPEKCEYADSQSGYAKGHRQGKRDLVDCIEAAGLKVKP